MSQTKHNSYFKVLGRVDFCFGLKYSTSIKLESNYDFHLVFSLIHIAVNRASLL